MCDDWDDLIEYVVHKFLNCFHGQPLATTPSDSADLATRASSAWSADGGDASAAAATAAAGEDGDDDDRTDRQATSSDVEPELNFNDLDTLRRRLLALGYGPQVHWIQSVLLTACSARLGTYAGVEFLRPVVRVASITISIFFFPSFL